MLFWLEKGSDFVGELVVQKPISWENTVGLFIVIAQIVVRQSNFLEDCTSRDFLSHHSIVVRQTAEVTVSNTVMCQRAAGLLIETFVVRQMGLSHDNPRKTWIVALQNLFEAGFCVRK